MSSPGSDCPRDQITKREHTRYLKGEIWSAMGCALQRMAYDIDPESEGETPESRGLPPFEEWKPSDYWVEVAREFEIDKHELCRAMRAVANQMDTKSKQAGRTVDDPYYDVVGNLPYIGNSPYDPDT
jgi:hypothetical protein